MVKLDQFFSVLVYQVFKGLEEMINILNLQILTCITSFCIRECSAILNCSELPLNWDNKINNIGIIFLRPMLV